ncbi:MAG: protein-L-isoaspartate O-methyltransferase [Alphaproteobacteria bacterium]
MKNITTPHDTTVARQNMIDGQLRPNRITDKALLARFAEVKREDFVPAVACGSAYADAPVALGNGREMVSPLLVGHLIQGLELLPTHTVLVAAGATGYSSALMAGLAGNVVMVEADKALMAVAKKMLKDFGNVTLVHGAVEAGAPQHGPFEAVLVDGAVENVPPTLLAQLKNGGRLAVVRPGADGVLEACIYAKHGNTVVEQALFETKGTVLPSLQVAERFVF